MSSQCRFFFNFPSRSLRSCASETSGGGRSNAVLRKWSSGICSNSSRTLETPSSCSMAPICPGAELPIQGCDIRFVVTCPSQLMHSGARPLASFRNWRGQAERNASCSAYCPRSRSDAMRSIESFAARSDRSRPEKMEGSRDPHHGASAWARTNSLVASERCVKFGISGVRQQRT